MFRKIREWSFPVGLIVAWVIASAYTAIQLGQLPAARAAAVEPRSV